MKTYYFKLILAILLSFLSFNSFAQTSIQYRNEMDNDTGEQVRAAYILSTSELGYEPIYLRIIFNQKIENTKLGLYGNHLVCETVKDPSPDRPDLCVIGNRQEPYRAALQGAMSKNNHNYIDIGKIHNYPFKEHLLFQPTLKQKDGTYHTYTFNLNGLKW